MLFFNGKTIVTTFVIVERGYVVRIKCTVINPGPRKLSRKVLLSFHVNPLLIYRLYKFACLTGLEKNICMIFPVYLFHFTGYFYPHISLLYDFW